MSSRMQVAADRSSRIERFISELEAIKNYDKVKRERDEALKKADPVGLLKQIIGELRKPENERVFPPNVKESGLVEELEKLIKARVKERIDFEVFWDRVTTTNKG